MRSVSNIDMPGDVTYLSSRHRLRFDLPVATSRSHRRANSNGEFSAGKNRLLGTWKIGKNRRNRHCT